MAPIKLEEQIKQKLEAREIKPSQDSWNRLNDKLDTDSKGEKNTYWFFGIAASIVGVILVSSIFFKDEMNSSNLETIVDIEKTELDFEMENISTKETSETLIENNRLKVAELEDQLAESEPSQSNSDHLLTERDLKILEDNKAEDLISANNTPNSLDIENKNQTTEATNRLTKIDLKVMEVVATIKNMKQRNGEVTDSEIDSLLKQAEKNILKQRIFEEFTRTVDAETLLQDVEDELDESFRAKVFDALKSGYEKVKTAVADRNN